MDQVLVFTEMGGSDLEAAKLETVLRSAETCEWVGGANTDTFRIVGGGDMVAVYCHYRAPQFERLAELAGRLNG